MAVAGLMQQLEIPITCSGGHNRRQYNHPGSPMCEGLSLSAPVPIRPSDILPNACPPQRKIASPDSLLMTPQQKHSSQVGVNTTHPRLGNHRMMVLPTTKRHCSEQSSSWISSHLSGVPNISERELEEAAKAATLRPQQTEKRSGRFDPPERTSFVLIWGKVWSSSVSSTGHERAATVRSSCAVW